jgi:hypothetical protein
MHKSATQQQKRMNYWYSQHLDKTLKHYVPKASLKMSYTV